MMLLAFGHQCVLLSCVRGYAGTLGQGRRWKSDQVPDTRPELGCNLLPLDGVSRTELSSFPLGQLVQGVSHWGFPGHT